MTAIKAVFFDFGGVFTESPFTFFDSFDKTLGMKSGQTRDIVFGPYNRDGDHPWHRLERGEITLETARADILALSQSEYGVDIDIYTLLAQMPRDAGLRQPLVDRVARLKEKSIPTAMITNNVKEFSDGWRALLPVDELFDFIIDSSFEGVRKPNPAIFTMALARMENIAAEEILFLDDYEANVLAASALGMQTIHVDADVYKTIAAIDQYLCE